MNHEQQQQRKEQTKSGARHQSSPSKDIEFDPSNPEEFMKQIRHQAIPNNKTTTVEDEEGMTLKSLLKLCHGLIQTNGEIWGRCRPFCCKAIHSDKDNDAASMSHKFIFYRVRHLNVRAHYGVPYFGSSSMEGTELILKSDPHVMKLAFQIPISLPSQLACLVPTPKPKKKDYMPNYGHIFRQSMLLADELVFTFLLGFKQFLEQQNRALGRVDVWLFQENEHRLFLQDQFSVTLPNNDNPSWYRLFAGRSANKVCGNFHKCSRCGQRMEFHNQNEMDDWFTCPTDHRPGCFPIQNQKDLVLLRCEFPGSIQFDVSIETAKGQSRLIHFLNFIRYESSTTTTIVGQENRVKKPRVRSLTDTEIQAILEDISSRVDLLLQKLSTMVEEKHLYPARTTESNHP